MRTLLDKTLDLAFGAAVLTRDKAQEFVDELIKRGEAAKEESGTLVDELLRRGQKQRETMQDMVKEQVNERVSRINLATRDDLARLERRIQELEVILADVRAKTVAPTPEEPIADAPRPMPEI